MYKIINILNNDDDIEKKCINIINNINNRYKECVNIEYNIDYNIIEYNVKFNIDKLRKEFFIYLFENKEKKYELHYRQTLYSFKIKTKYINLEYYYDIKQIIIDKVKEDKNNKIDVILDKIWKNIIHIDRIRDEKEELLKKINDAIYFDIFKE